MGPQELATYNIDSAMPYINAIRALLPPMGCSTWKKAGSRIHDRKELLRLLDGGEHNAASLMLVLAGLGEWLCVTLKDADIQIIYSEDSGGKISFVVKDPLDQKENKNGPTTDV